jgi:cytochrome b561
MPKLHHTDRYALHRRLVHWVVAVGVMLLVPSGLWMVARAQADLWDSVTNTLYGIHKATGFTVLMLMVLRIAFKLRNADPPYPQTLPKIQRIAAKSLHHLLYVLLVAVPLLGWAGITAFPALIVFPGLDLPALPFIPVDQDLAQRLFQIHGVLAISLAVLAAAHIGAALHHLVIRKDGLFARMWFSS